MKIAENILELIGNTPLVKINSLNKLQNATIAAKLESFNPANSIKDRVALNMVETAEKEILQRVDFPQSHDSRTALVPIHCL